MAGPGGVVDSKSVIRGFDPHSARERIVREGDVEDLTKLSGPELADYVNGGTRAESIEWFAVLAEAARRLREDTRVWQRRLEQERDGLRAELAESKRLLGTMAKADLEGVRDSERLKHWRKWAESFWCVLDTDGSDGAMMNAVAVMLHDAETRAESAENRLESDASKPIPVIKIEAGDAYVADLMRERDHWKSKAIGTQAQIDRDDRIAQGRSTAELVAELDALTVEVTGSDCTDAHEWLEMLAQGNESRGEPHGFAQVIKNELQFASMEMSNLKADRDEWLTQHENLLAMYRTSEQTCHNQRKELHSLNVERAKTLTKLEDAQARIAELDAQLRDAQAISPWAQREIDGIRGSRAAMEHARTEREGKAPEPAERKPAQRVCESCDGRGKFYPSTNEPGELAEPYDCDECDGTGKYTPEPADGQAPCAFKVGDRVTVDGQSGVVIEIDLPWIVVKPYAGMFGTWSSHVSQVRKAEPAERKPHGTGWIYTLLDIEQYGEEHDTVVRDMAIKLRQELLAERVAIEALAADFLKRSRRGGAWSECLEDCAQELREVLDGKR